MAAFAGPTLVVSPVRARQLLPSVLRAGRSPQRGGRQPGRSLRWPRCRSAARPVRSRPPRSTTGPRPAGFSPS